MTESGLFKHPLSRGLRPIRLQVNNPWKYSFNGAADLHARKPGGITDPLLCSISNQAPAELAEKTIDYAEAKTAYFKALRDEVPE